MTEGQNDTTSPGSGGWLDRGRRIFSRPGRLVPFGLGLLLPVVAFLVYGSLTAGPDDITLDEIESTVASVLGSATPPPAVSSQVYQTILPSLVVVRTESSRTGREEVFEIGSGVIINSAAAILTSLHVVDGAREIEVSFADGTRTSATISDRQPENDIAVLTPATPPNVFAPATIGSPSVVRVGDEVFAVGNPLGLTGSMTAGVISGFDRVYTPADSDIRVEGVIQFDAAVNPGNSGGPLLDRNGHVIGIVTGLVNPTEQEFFVGIGFAVPIGVAAGAAGAPAQ